MLSISIGLSNTIWGITSEIIPSYLLSHAQGLVEGWSWILQFVINLFFLDIIDDDVGRYVMFIVFAIIGLIAWLYTFFYLPETVDNTVKGNLELLYGKDELVKMRNKLTREYGLKDIHDPYRPRKKNALKEYR